jgi:hypothetical protein
MKSGSVLGGATPIVGESPGSQTHGMTTDPNPVRPISTLKIGTPLLVAIVLAVAAPVGIAWAVGSGAFDPGKEDTSPVTLSGPVTSVVIAGLDGPVRVIADPAVNGVTGRATVDWHGDHRPQLVETVKDGVATLDYDRSTATDQAAVSWDVTVPPTAAVTVGTTNGSAELTGVGGAVTVTTSNASISGDRLGSGAASFESSNGDITVDFAGAPTSIKAKSSNANVTVVTDGKTPYFDRTSTSNGNTVRDNLGSDDYTLATTRMIDVRTTNGNVTVH